MIFTSELRQKTIHSLWWSAADNFGVQLIQFFITIVLARQLFPEQYGLIAMLSIFMAIAQSFVDSGFASALIQKQDATELHYSSVFYFNLIMGIATAGCLCLSAGYIARFYHQEILRPLTWFMSLNLIFGALGTVQTTLMTKNMNFRTQTFVNLLAIVSSGGIGIAMAAAGFGVWSLAVQSVSSTFFRTVFLWIFNKWRPSRSISLSAIRELFGFGSRLLAAGLLDVIFGNLYQLVIGKIFTAGDLGFYTQASQVKQMPTSSLTAIVGRVSFPLFSIIQDDTVRFKKALQKVVTFLGMVNCPLMIGLAVCAKPVIMVLFTDKWAPAIPYLQILCLVGLLWPLQVVNLDVLKATGHSELFFRLEVLKKVLTVANIAIAYRWGVIAIVYGQVIAAFLAYLLNSYYTGELVNYNSREQLKDCLPYLLISILMGAIVLIIPTLLTLNYLPLLVIQVTGGGLIYITLCWLLGLNAFLETLDTLGMHGLVKRRRGYEY